MSNPVHKNRNGNGNGNGNEKMLKTILTDLGLPHCLSIHNTKCTGDNCQALMKACVTDVANIDCDHVKKTVADLVKVMKGVTAPKGGSSPSPFDAFADAWNKYVVLDSVYQLDAGEIVAKLPSNLKCFATEMNRLAPSGTTKQLKVPGNDLQKGMLKGLKAISRLHAAIIVVAGFVLLMVLGGVLHALKKDTPLFSFLVSLLVMGAVVVTIMLV